MALRSLDSAHVIGSLLARWQPRTAQYLETVVSCTFCPVFCFMAGGLTLGPVTPSGLEAEASKDFLDVALSILPSSTIPATQKFYVVWKILVH